MTTKLEAHRQQITGQKPVAGPRQPIPRLVRAPMNTQAHPAMNRAPVKVVKS